MAMTIVSNVSWFRSAAFSAALGLAVLPLVGAPMVYAEEIEPLPTSREALAGRLRAAGLSPKGVARLAELARPALVLETTPAGDDAIPTGASKLGGAPDLPDGMPWPLRPPYEGASELEKQFRDEAAALYADAGTPPPFMPEAEARALVEKRRRDRDEARAATIKLMTEAGLEVDRSVFDAPGAKPEEIERSAAGRLALAEAAGKPFPLAFIGQFDLAALSGAPGFDADLPKTGRLLLFYDLWMLPPSYEPRAGAGLRLLYDATPPEALRRTQAPDVFRSIHDLGETQLKPVTIAAKPVTTTVPDVDAAWTEAGIGEKDGELYSQWIYSIGWPTAAAGGNHQLGGWPRAIQSGMQSTSQLASNGISTGTSEASRTPEAQRLLSGAKDWRLVLQIGRDDGAGLTLPGAFYVLMRRQDIAERRFEKAWLVYEQD